MADIYDNRTNQTPFARFLDTCPSCDGKALMLGAVRALDRVGVEGVGPAARKSVV